MSVGAAFAVWKPRRAISSGFGFYRTAASCSLVLSLGFSQGAWPVADPVDVEKLEDLKWYLEQVYPLPNVVYASSFSSLAAFREGVCASLGQSGALGLLHPFRIILADDAEVGTSPSGSPNIGEVGTRVNPHFVRRWVRISRSCVCRLHNFRRTGDPRIAPQPGPGLQPDPAVPPSPFLLAEVVSLASHEGAHFSNINWALVSPRALGITGIFSSLPELRECVSRLIRSATQWGAELDSVSVSIEVLASAAVLYRFTSLGGTTGPNLEASKDVWLEQMNSQYTFPWSHFNEFCSWAEDECVAELLESPDLSEDKQVALRELVSRILAECERREKQLDQVRLRRDHLIRVVCPLW